MTVMQQGLLIAGIGMGLVFVVIIFLWGLMALMMRVTSGKKKEELPTVTDEPLLPDIQNLQSTRRAAAAAVAVALASAGLKKQMSSRPGEMENGSLTPWQAVHRARQLGEKNLRG
jgi:Na+-transporting methylmalonyl-CoA/oxaloacetate decarboxylase gamma subunit